MNGVFFSDSAAGRRLPPLAYSSLPRRRDRSAGKDRARAIVKAWEAGAPRLRVGRDGVVYDANPMSAANKAKSALNKKPAKRKKPAAKRQKASPRTVGGNTKKKSG